jgi:7tm Chemosensory receptor
MFFKFTINWRLVFEGLIGFFSCCGFCPIKIDITTKPTKGFELLNIVLPIWSVFHLVLAAACVNFALQEFSSVGSDASNFNNILKFTVIALTYFATSIESFFVRRNFIEIWRGFTLIDEMIGKMLPNYRAILKDFYKQTSKKILIYLAFTTVIEILIIANIRNVESWAFMWFVTVIPLSISRLRHLQHTLYIDSLTCRFRVIKNELKAIVKLTKLDSNKLLVKNFHFYEGLFKKISTIKSVYNTLWETSLFINRSFGVSQLANLLQNFVQLTCDLYLIYSFLYKNNLSNITGNR